MFKNTTGQIIRVYVEDATTGLPYSGQANTLTAYVEIDGGTITALADTSATERDATKAKGWYEFLLAQGETNGDELFFSAKSSNSNAIVIPVPAVVYTISSSQAADVAAAVGSTINVNIIAPASGSTLDLTKGDDWQSGITVTKSALETHWPTTLSNVHFWAEPTAGLLSDDSSARGMPRIVTASSVTSSSTTATITLPAGHGLVTGVHAIRGANQPEYNGYYTLTISSNSATYTFAGSPTTPATGTIKIQPGIACSVMQATGSSQAFSFAPTAAQLQLVSAPTSRADGYRFAFVANAVSNPRTLRGGPMNTRPSPTGT